MEQLILAVYI